MYNNLVLADPTYLGNFLKPIFSLLNKLETRYLAGLALGKSLSEMAAEHCRSEKYLEQVMLKIRRKVSGADALDKPTINRNQLFYYAGLVNIIRQVDEL